MSDEKRRDKGQGWHFSSVEPRLPHVPVLEQDEHIVEVEAYAVIAFLLGSLLTGDLADMGFSQPDGLKLIHSALIKWKLPPGVVRKGASGIGLLMKAANGFEHSSRAKIRGFILDVAGELGFSL